MIATKTPNKRERRILALERHYDTLEHLARFCGVKNPNGKKLSVALLKFERDATRITTAYCNGIGNIEEVDKFLEAIEEKVMGLFAGRLDGFFINRDPRGYALKIGEEETRTTYKDIGLHRDWGGYGILSPEIE